MSNLAHKIRKAFSEHRFVVLMLLLPLLNGCFYKSAGHAHLKLVDQSCSPIIDRTIKVNNVESAGFLQSGHLTKDTYQTDELGQIRFNIEQVADRLIVFLPDVFDIHEEDMRWNWWTVTSNRDEVLLSGAGRFKIDQFKQALLASSRDKPIVIVYPYKRSSCGNDRPDLDEFNSLKIFADQQAKEAARKAARAAAEQARIDAIQVVVPEYQITGYGYIRSYMADNRIQYEIPQNSSRISSNFPKFEGQISGNTFGIVFSTSTLFVIKYPDDLYAHLIHPDAGVIDLDTGAQVEPHLSFIQDTDAQGVPKNSGAVILSNIKDNWQLSRGDWIFQIKYKDSVLAEQKFVVE